MSEIIDRYKEEIADQLEEVCVFLGARISKQKDGMKSRGFYEPHRFERALDGHIEQLLLLIEDYELYVEALDVNYIKEWCANKVSKIKINIPVLKNIHITIDQLEILKKFKEIQFNCQIHLLKKLSKKGQLDHKLRKFAWRGSQRQLIELFDKLIENGWIAKEEISQHLQCLPIIQAFDLEKTDSEMSIPINSDSFNREWKQKSVKGHTYRLPPNYIKVFHNLPKLPNS